LAIGAPSITTLLDGGVIRQSRTSIFFEGPVRALLFRNLNVELGPRNRELGQLRDVWPMPLRAMVKVAVCGEYRADIVGLN